MLYETSLALTVTAKSAGEPQTGSCNLLVLATSSNKNVREATILYTQGEQCYSVSGRIEQQPLRT
jgi:hypothetical protein